MPDPHQKEALTPPHFTSLSELESASYETTMKHYFGVGEWCGSTDVNMHVAYLDPGEETRAHYHVRADIALFVIEGESTMITWDQNHVPTEHHLKQGDFGFIPRGTIHKDINKTGARFGLVAAYNNVGTGPESLKVYVEAPVGGGHTPRNVAGTN